MPVYASSKIKILPYQIAAARFSVRSRHLKGCILCDEGSLGKTYEALLVVAQKWYEGQERILIVLPQNLMEQWQSKLENEFMLPMVSFAACQNNEKGICLMTYEEAVRQAETLSSIPWDIAVFDEADFLFKPENKSVIALKKATASAFKLLLTPTPLTMSIMDIYGLIHFIDESVLPETDSFYKRYFRKPENYGELSEWVSQFAFRTLKNQVAQYVPFTNRLPVVLDYPLNETEKKLYELVDKYLALPNKTAYPEMESYQLTLQFFHTISSSAQAFFKMLNAPIERASGREKTILQTMQKRTEQLPINAKMAALLKALEDVFAHLKKTHENQKALIFVDNLTTLEVLNQVVTDKGWKIAPDLKTFREDKSTQLYITNDTVAKGLDIEYCPVVINYDLLYNAVEMEQRICRCHRQGQQSDVLVLNFLSKENFSDVRILELINKRTLQFGSIFGMSDDIVGHFDVSLGEVLQKRRSVSEIAQAMNQTLKDNRPQNEEMVNQAENALFTTFTKEVSDKVSVSPKYIEEQAEALNDDLWQVVKYYFEVNHPEYVIDEVAKTITLSAGTEAPHLFYYWTGTRNTPYQGKTAYGLSKDFKPASGQITFTSILVKGILKEMACPSEGQVRLATESEPCSISLYNVVLRSNKTFLAEYDVLVGKTETGRILSAEECRQILKLPVQECSTSEKYTSYWLTLSTGSNRSEIDEELKNILLKPYLSKHHAQTEDECFIKLKASRQKALLEQSLTILKTQIKHLKETSSGDRLAELQSKKELNTLEKELKRKEENLFLEKIKIDAEIDREIITLSRANILNMEKTEVFRVEIKYI